MTKWVLLGLVVVLTSCAPTVYERAARDRIMLVRESPQTLGHLRLVTQVSMYPDLGEFIGGKGQPDFIAETVSDDRHYLILYYLERGEAYACRSWRNQAVIEFAGPYPITKKEKELLGKMKDGVVLEVEPASVPN